MAIGIRRREIIVALGSAGAWSHTGRAQQAAMPQISSAGDRWIPFTDMMSAFGS